LRKVFRVTIDLLYPSKRKLRPEHPMTWRRALAGLAQQMFSVPPQAFELDPPSPYRSPSRKRWSRLS
jgi:hypothetical protein